MSQTRCLIVIRLSHLTDATTSPARQLAVCTDYAAARDWTVVGVAEDLDVSASVTSPFDRPSLRPWLERHHDYDVVLFWRVDRLVRRVVHLANMIEWSDKHGVNLVSATEAHFDLSTSIGRVIAIMVAMFAQMESEATSERTKQAFDHNIRAGKYRGGHPPWGYRAVKEGNEWRLEIDPVTAPVVRGLVDRILDGEGPSKIAADLCRAGIPTPHDSHRLRSGLPSKGQLWRATNLRRALQSPTLLGQITVTENGKKDGGGKVRGERTVLRDDSGQPIVRAEPLIDPATFARLQAALSKKGDAKAASKRSQALLLRVVFCGVCERPMYRYKGRSHLYYRCASHTLGISCGNGALRQTEADELIESYVENTLGPFERMNRVYDPGSDTSAELAELDAELEDVAGVIGTGPFRTGPARDRLMVRAEALSRRREQLAATDHRPAGYRLVGTGVTVSEYWAGLGQQERNMFLRDAGVKMTYNSVEPDVAIGWGDLVAAVGSAMGVPGTMIDTFRFSNVENITNDVRADDQQRG